MDTIAIYAVAPVCAQESGRVIRYVYVGTVTDSVSPQGTSGESDMMETILSEQTQPYDQLVSFLVQQVLIRFNEGANQVT